MAQHTRQNANQRNGKSAPPANAAEARGAAPPRQETNGSARPAYEVWVVTDRGENQKAWWTKIGAAWTNKDGSLSVNLEALPVDGRLQLRVPLPPRDDA